DVRVARAIPAAEQRLRAVAAQQRDLDLHRDAPSHVPLPPARPKGPRPTEPPPETQENLIARQPLRIGSWARLLVLTIPKPRENTIVSPTWGPSGPTSPRKVVSPGPIEMVSCMPLRIPTPVPIPLTNSRFAGTVRSSSNSTRSPGERRIV